MSEPTVTETCKFPGCANAPEPASAKPGRPPEYCVDPAHNPVSAWRERKRLADAERGVTTSEADVEQPVTMARVTGAEMLRQMRDLAGQLAGVARAAHRRRGHPRRPGRGRGRGRGRAQGR